MIRANVGPILYVDDTEEQRYAMRRMLEKAGFDVLEAGTGAQALQLVQQQPAAVVLDVRLPDMNGFDVCRAIKSNPQTASIPVLQISASFADPAKRAAGLSAGADAYLAQPVYPAELVAVVKGLIRASDSERMLRFFADVSAKLSASLDYEATCCAIRSVFIPAFADRCELWLSSRNSFAGTTARECAGAAEFADLAAQVSHTGQSILLRRDNGSIAASVIVAPLKIANRPVGSLVFALTTDGREYTQSDIVFADEFADRAALALQNAELYTAQQAAQDALVRSEKLAAAGRLTAAIAHELNNPLEAITNLVYLISIAPEASPNIKQWAADALGELSRVAHIAKQTLGFYRELRRPTEFDLAESIDEIIDLYERRMESKSIEVRHHHDSPIPVNAVRGEIMQVISNLLVNAMEATEANGRIDVSTTIISDGRAQITISDQGHGISPDLMSKIFEPFFTTKPGTGTGLGLWVSENIIRKHGGTISVRSSNSGDTRGTVFTVTLPMVHSTEFAGK